MIEVKDDGTVWQDGYKIADEIHEASWNQGLLESLHGIYQNAWDTLQCDTCHHSYQVRRKLRFHPAKGAGLLADYYEQGEDSGCMNRKCPKAVKIDGDH